MATQVDWIFPFSNVSWQFGVWYVNGSGPIPPGAGINVLEDGAVIKLGATELNFTGDGAVVTSGGLTRANVRIERNAITSITHVNADAALGATDDTIVCDTVFGTTLNVTLADALALLGKEIRIKNDGYGMVRLLPFVGGQEIEHATSYLISSPFQAIRLQTDGTNWFVL